MQSFLSQFLGVLVVQQALSARAIPTFNIDLDLPPEERWTKVTEYYKDEAMAMAPLLDSAIESELGNEYETWLNLVSMEAEYVSEIRGILKDRIRLFNQTNIDLEREVKKAVLTAHLYELANISSPACSGVLWATSNGTVMHGRNMDYTFPFVMPDGQTKDWTDITYNAILMKDKKPFIKATMWPGSVGLHTAMRIGGWSFEQNTRHTNERQGNFEALQSGGHAFSTVVRRIMETTPDFETAKAKLYGFRFAAPQYFIMSGSRPYEGAVLTIDRLGQHHSMPQTPPIQYVGQSPSTSWHLVQTNDDLLKPALDPRRPFANYKLANMSQEFVSELHLLQFMHTVPMLNPLTAFSTVMVPATGFYTSILPNDSVNGSVDTFDSQAADLMTALLTAMSTPLLAAEQKAAASTSPTNNSIGTVSMRDQASVRPPRRVGNSGSAKRKGRFLGPAAASDEDVDLASMMQLPFDRSEV